MRIDANSTGVAPNSGASRARVREAISLSGSSQKEFAINCKQPQSVISEALAGTRALPVEWMESQSDSFKFHYNELQRRDWNINRETEQDELVAMAERFFGAMFRLNQRSA